MPQMDSEMETNLLFHGLVVGSMMVELSGDDRSGELASGCCGFGNRFRFKFLCTSLLVILFIAYSSRITRSRDGLVGCAAGAAAGFEIKNLGRKIMMESCIADREFT
jgi:hypothetical protein